MDKSFKIIFYGADDFAVPGLLELTKRYSVVAAVTYDDRPSRRGNKKLATPVKLAALKLGVNLIEIPREKLSSDKLASEIRGLKPDLGVVISFAILPSHLINIPSLGTINVHPSLLPRYRGAAPINWAIINGEKKTGITVLLVSEKVDAGKIVLQKELDIYENETAGELRERIKKIYPQILIEGIEKLNEPNFKPTEQKEELASRAPKISEYYRRVDWSRDALKVNDLIRGLSPNPAAFALFRDKKIKLLRSKVLSKENINSKPGEIIGIFKEEPGLIVSTGHGTILITELQPENKNVMNGLDFWNGYRIKKGESFQ